VSTDPVLIEEGLPWTRRLEKDLRHNVVVVAQRREAAVSIRQVTQAFWIAETCRQTRLRKAVIAARDGLGITAAGSTESSDLRKRIWLIEQESHMPRCHLHTLHRC